jgi:hypothetical protein
MVKDGDTGTCSTSDRTGCELQIWNVANPAAPDFIGGADDAASAANSDGLSDVAMQGRYIYVTKDAADTGTCSSGDRTGCEFQIWDISTPTAPTFTNGMDNAASAANSDAAFRVFASGSYAYIAKAADTGTCSTGDRTGCEMQIYDITDPATPAFVGGADNAASAADSDNALGLVVRGRYVYLTKAGDSGTCSTSTQTGCELQVWDVADPTAPAFKTGAESGTNDGMNWVFVAGKYAYVAKDLDTGTCSSGTRDGCELQVFDTTGIEATSVIAHSLEAGGLQVRENAFIFNHLKIGGGLSVGIGGINTAGDLVTSNLGVNFSESDSNPNCTTGDYKIYADTSEAMLKKCVNGVVTDIQEQQDVVTAQNPNNVNWADNNTTDLWATLSELQIVVPSGGEVLVLASFSTTAVDPAIQNESLSARIDREGAGVASDCADTNDVGVPVIGTYTDNATADPAVMIGGSAAFVDTGTTAGGTFTYAVCTEADGTAIGGGTWVMDIFELTLMNVNDAGDLAEIYPTNDASIEAGDVVSLDPNGNISVQKSTKAYDKSAIGVVATKPAMVIGSRDGEGVDGKPIALSGRVPVKVKGPIKKGDIITSSSTPGVAMKATKAGPMLGIAMTDYSGSGTGTVMLYVKTGYFNGSNLADIMANTNVTTNDELNPSASILSYFLNTPISPAAEDFSEILTDRLAAGLEVITPKVTTDKVALNSIETATAENIQINDDVVINGTLTVDKIKANQIEGLEILAGSFGRLEQAEDPGRGALLDPLSNGSTTAEEGRMIIDSATVTLNLSVNGLLEANGGLVVNGLAQFNGDTIFDKLVTFSDKSLFKGDAEFEGRTTLNNDSGGFALVRAGQQEVEILFDKPYDQSPVISLAIKNGQFAQYAYSEIKVNPNDPTSKIKGFKILLQQATTTDLEFSWTALSIKDPRTAQN